MLIGEYWHGIDAKGRIIIPSKFRDELGEAFIITRGLDKCLVIYTMAEWDKITTKIKQLPITDQSVRKFIRFFVGGASDVYPDAQGRVLIPQNLKEYAGLKKDIVSIGVSAYVEIWSKENFNTYNDENFIDEELAVHMSQLGI